MPLSMRDVRETITHLMSLTRYEDVQVTGPAGWRRAPPLRAGSRACRRSHRVSRHARRAEEDLRRAVVERFGRAPTGGARGGGRTGASGCLSRPRLRAADDHAAHRDHAQARSRVDGPGHRSGPARAHPRHRVRRGRSRRRSPFAGSHVAVGRAVRRGGGRCAAREIPGDAARARLLRSARDSTASTSSTAAPSFASRSTAARTCRWRFPATRCPKPSAIVSCRSAPRHPRTRTCSRTRAARSRSTSTHAAIATPTRRTRATRSTRRADVRFTITRGPRYVVDDVTITGNTAVPTAELAPIVAAEGRRAVRAGDARRRRRRHPGPVPRARLHARDGDADGGGAACGTISRRRRPIGTCRSRSTSPKDRARWSARSISSGNMVLTAEQIRAVADDRAGQARTRRWTSHRDRDRIDLEYRNRGYESVVVDPRVMLADGDTRANVLFTISEGPQVIVDHVIIVGNQRTSTATIQRELTLQPGEPLGYAARIESQQRLSALGLFRRVNITELPHESESRRDVLVQVEEAPPTTISLRRRRRGAARCFGRPVQAARRRSGSSWRRAGRSRSARSNLWGKNRSVDLFTRASLRSRDVARRAIERRARLRRPRTTNSSYGFNEYRVLATYREPKVFNTRADVLSPAILDQAKRSSFNFRTREVRGEAGLARHAQVQRRGTLLVPAHEALRHSVSRRTIRSPADRSAVPAGAPVEVLELADSRHPRRPARPVTRSVPRAEQRCRRARRSALRSGS